MYARRNILSDIINSRFLGNHLHKRVGHFTKDGNLAEHPSNDRRSFRGGKEVDAYNLNLSSFCKVAHVLCGEDRIMPVFRPVRDLGIPTDVNAGKLRQVMCWVTSIVCNDDNAPSGLADAPHLKESRKRISKMLE